MSQLIYVVEEQKLDGIEFISAWSEGGEICETWNLRPHGGLGGGFVDVEGIIPCASRRDMG